MKDKKIFSLLEQILHENKWYLYKSHPKYKEANKELNDGWEKAKKMKAKDAYKHMVALQKKHKHVGAWDSEPDEVLHLRMQRHFGKEYKRPDRWSGWEEEKVVSSFNVLEEGASFDSFTVEAKNHEHAKQVALDHMSSLAHEYGHGATGHLGYYHSLDYKGVAQTEDHAHSHAIDHHVKYEPPHLYKIKNPKKAPKEGHHRYLVAGWSPS